MGMPGAARFNRMPTRHRLQLFWIFLFGAGASREFLNLTIHRVNPKREEQIYIEMQDKYGGKLPERFTKEIVALREMRDTLTMHMALESPTPGQTAGALQKELDPRKLGELRK
mgnify:CR=1 FL=1